MLLGQQLLDLGDILGLLSDPDLLLDDIAKLYLTLESLINHGLLICKCDGTNLLEQ